MKKFISQKSFSQKIILTMFVALFLGGCSLDTRKPFYLGDIVKKKTFLDYFRVGCFYGDNGEYEYTIVDGTSYLGGNAYVTGSGDGLTTGTFGGIVSKVFSDVEFYYGRELTGTVNGDNIDVDVTSYIPDLAFFMYEDVEYLYGYTDTKGENSDMISFAAGDEKKLDSIGYSYFFEKIGNDKVYFNVIDDDIYAGVSTYSTGSINHNDGGYYVVVLSDRNRIVCADNSSIIMDTYITGDVSVDTFSTSTVNVTASGTIVVTGTGNYNSTPNAEAKVTSAMNEYFQENAEKMIDFSKINIYY